MSWARFDDNYSLNPKVLAAGFLAELLDMRAIIWCARYETDGFVSEDSLSIVGRSIPSVKQKVKKLIEVGRWEEGAGQGWWIIHYLAYNPSHEECERRRKEGKERAARSRERTAHERRTSGLGSGDPRGGDGYLSRFDGFAISQCALCDSSGFVINENNEAEICAHLGLVEGTA